VHAPVAGHHVHLAGGALPQALGEPVRMVGVREQKALLAATPSHPSSRGLPALLQLPAPLLQPPALTPRQRVVAQVGINVSSITPGPIFQWLLFFRHLFNLLCPLPLFLLLIFQGYPESVDSVELLVCQLRRGIVPPTPCGWKTAAGIICF